jgi:hypothetical protein
LQANTDKKRLKRSTILNFEIIIKVWLTVSFLF